jgi:hypothetical protein
MLEPFVTKRSGNQHHGARQSSSIIAAEIRDQGTRVAVRRCTKNERSNLFATADIVANGSYGLALPNDDLGLDSGFVEDFADRRADDALDPKALFLLDSGLNAPELYELLRLDDSEYLDATTGFGSAPRGEAERDARFVTVVDHD